jgi:hypothetical protein
VSITIKYKIVPKKTKNGTIDKKIAVIEGPPSQINSLLPDACRLTTDAENKIAKQLQFDFKQQMEQDNE